MSRKTHGTNPKSAKKSQAGLNKISDFFKNLWALIKGHKIVSSVVCVILALVIAGSITVNHYLSKINYEPVDKTLVSSKTVTLASGEVIDLSRITKDSDGTYTLSDGRRVDEFGTVWNTDGSVIFYNGSYLNPDGIAVLCDGTTIYTDTTVVHYSGKVVAELKLAVDKSGWTTLPDGTKAHICSFTVSEDGQIIYKDQSEVPAKYRAKKGEKEDSSISVEDPDYKQTFEDGDRGIEKNFGDKNIWYSDDVLNVLLMGIDSGENRNTESRSDSMILVSVNRKTNKVRMVSLIRGAYVAISGYNNTRLSHAYEYGGAALTIDTIERNYKIRVDNYVSTTFDGFKAIIDSIGGVSLYFNSREATALKNKILQQGYTYKGEGTYNANGELALNYARLRKIDSDSARTQRQRNVLYAIVNKMKQLNVLQISDMLNKVLPYVTTDLSKTQMLSQIGHVPAYLSNEIEQSTVPYKISPHKIIDKYDVMILDWDSEIAHLHKFLYADADYKTYQK